MMISIYPSNLSDREKSMPPEAKYEHSKCSELDAAHIRMIKYESTLHIKV